MIPLTTAVTANPHHVLCQFLLYEPHLALGTDLFVILSTTATHHTLHLHLAHFTGCLPLDIHLVELILNILLRVEHYFISHIVHD